MRNGGFWSVVVLTALAGAAGCKGKQAAPAAAPAAAASDAGSKATTPAVATASDAAAAPEVGRPSTDPPPDLRSPPSDAEKTPSGIPTRRLLAGSGQAHPGQDDMVAFHYVSWSNAGELFGNTYPDGIPKASKVSRLVVGYREVLALMVVGERRRAWIPGALGRPQKKGAPPGEDRVVDLELVSLEAAPAAPADLLKPPADATKLPSGLVFKELAPGTGTAKPSPDASVRVRYSGWTEDGRCFEFTSSGGAGSEARPPQSEPATFALKDVIDGWAQGLARMTEGQKARVWIPEALAYKHEWGKPAGTLVFDLELVTIIEPKQ